MATSKEETERRRVRYAQLRAALGLSLEGLARRLDVSLSTSQRYASGSTPVPAATLELLERLVVEGQADAKPKAKRRRS